MNKIKYEKKIKYYKSIKNNNKINKYLNKLNIYEIKLENTNMIGGMPILSNEPNITNTHVTHEILSNEPNITNTHVTQEILYNDYNFMFIIASKNNGTFNLINKTLIGKGINGDVYSFDLIKDDVKIKKVVLKSFDIKNQYNEEKQIYSTFKNINLDKQLNCKLLYYSDDSKILIFDYLGVSLHNLKLKKYSFYYRLKMVEDLLTENFKLMQKGIIHNDIKIQNIVYNDETKTLSMIDYGIAQNITDEIKIINTTFNALSFYYLEIFKIYSKYSKEKKQENIESSANYLKYKKLYKNAAMKSQMFTLGIISLCILIGNFEFISYRYMYQFFGYEVKEDSYKRFLHFNSKACSTYLANIVSDFQQQIRYINIKTNLSNDELSNLLYFFTTFGMWHLLLDNPKYSHLLVTDINPDDDNANLTILKNTINIIKSLKHNTLL